MKQDTPRKPDQKNQTDRQARLAEALRENLKRRKAASGAAKPKAIKNKETH